MLQCVFRILGHLKYRTMAHRTGLTIVQERENTDIQEHALDMRKAEFTRRETTGLLFVGFLLFGLFDTAEFSLCIQWEYGGALRGYCITGWTLLCCGKSYLKMP